ncbi:hypothetical protein CEXT_40331 [Caerostris extrusa]|uniref:Reverse transcriptase n=1 Tax=Caerostris extrusa TaxID=172846 RepID=A0AAV4YBK9_CAEEX|nr:hypothetical protein CEXT_40331 [Caerostris extrusa]
MDAVLTHKIRKSKGVQRQREGGNTSGSSEYGTLPRCSPTSDTILIEFFIFPPQNFPTGRKEARIFEWKLLGLIITDVIVRGMDSDENGFELTHADVFWFVMEGSSIVNLTRVQEDFYVNQIISGHGTLGLPKQIFGKAAACTCGHSLEVRKHLIFDCPQWDSIRQKFFPPNFKKSAIDLLIFNNKSRNGLREIMKHKFQTLLSSLENEDTPA